MEIENLEVTPAEKRPTLEEYSAEFDQCLESEIKLFSFAVSELSQKAPISVLSLYQELETPFVKPALSFEIKDAEIAKLVPDF